MLTQLKKRCAGDWNKFVAILTRDKSRHYDKYRLDHSVHLFCVFVDRNIRLKQVMVDTQKHTLRRKEKRFLLQFQPLCGNIKIAVQVELKMQRKLCWLGPKKLEQQTWCVASCYERMVVIKLYLIIASNFMQTELRRVHEAYEQDIHGIVHDIKLQQLASFSSSGMIPTPAKVYCQNSWLL